MSFPPPITKFEGRLQWESRKNQPGFPIKSGMTDIQNNFSMIEILRTLLIQVSIVSGF